MKKMSKTFIKMIKQYGDTNETNLEASPSTF